MNSDFADHGFSGFGICRSFDERLAGLDREVRENLLAMLSRSHDLPGNLLNEASDTLQPAGISDDNERRHLARRIICDARATAARLYRNDAAQQIVASSSGLGALMAQPNMVGAPVSSSAAPATGEAPPMPTQGEVVAQARYSDPPGLTAGQARFAAMTPLQAVEEYMRSKPRTGGPQGPAGNALVVHVSDAHPDHVAATQLAVDRQVEQSPVTQSPVLV